MGHIWATIALLVIAELPLSGQAGGTTPPSRSAPLAAKLVTMLEGPSQDSAAAADPQQEGRYVAVLVYPRTQILAIAGNYSVPQLLNERLLNKAYRDVYVELNRAANREGRLFVQDLGADGLHAIPESGSSPDIVYRDTTRSVILNGDWKAQSMTKQAYMEAFTSADADYAALLQRLIEQVMPSEAR